MLKDEPNGRPGTPSDVLSAPAPRRFIDLIPHPACVVDSLRHIQDLNERARSLLAGGEQLFVRSGRLHGQTAAAVSELDAYLEAPQRWAGSLTLRYTRKAPACDMIVRVERNAVTCVKCTDSEPRFLVHMFLPTDDWSIPEDVLRLIHGLTPGEARVVHLLLRGSRVTSVARDLGISAETARTHLKHVMRKLEVSTQMQLVQVLASGPWR